MSGARLMEAFSLRAGLRALFVPASARLRPIDGLRALAILWVIAFHAAWYSLGHVTPATYLGLLGARWMLPIWRGDFGVDLFFVVSGFLIAGLLLDERARSGRVRLGLFYLRRLMRLWPALVVTVVVDQLLFRDFPSSVWASLFYVSNFVSVARVCVAWSWSLAIEEQFYLVCPWLLRALTPLGPTFRLAALLALGCALCGLGAYVVVHHHFVVSDAEIVVNRHPVAYITAYDHLYSKPWMRSGPLLAGVSAAVLFRMPRVMGALARSKLGASLALPLALAMAALSTHWPLFDAAPRAVEVAYLACYRSVFGVAIAYVLLLSVSEHPVGRVLGRALGARALHPIAQLAYTAYLLNPIVAMTLHPRLAARAATSPMAVFWSADLVATFGAALALHLFVERPFMQLRPRAHD